jgi:hypothetical protein
MNVQVDRGPAVINSDTAAVTIINAGQHKAQEKATTIERLITERNMHCTMQPICSSNSSCGAQEASCQHCSLLEPSTCSSSSSNSSSSTSNTSSSSSSSSSGDNGSSSSSSTSSRITANKAEQSPSKPVTCAAASAQPTGKQRHSSSAANLANRMQERLPPRLSSSSGSVVSLISEGVKFETWLVGLQHKLLLGVAPGATSAAPSTAATAAAAQESECFCGATCNNTLHRPLYRLLQEAADFAERACLDRRFLCQQYLSRLVFAGAFFFGCAYINALATMISTHR